MKRTIDLIVCCILLPFAVPLCLIAAAAVWLECRAAPFFFQVRLGRHEAPFTMLKIRTMHVDTIQAASHDIGPQKILKVGRFLRATKIDELPQLWNVMRGEMSLVGPRPGLPMQTELTVARRFYDVYNLKPGITGLSQILGVDMSTPWDLAKNDAYYGENWHLTQDIGIMWLTLIGKGAGDSATIKRKR